MPTSLLLCPEIKLCAAELTLRAYQTNYTCLVAIPRHVNIATGVAYSILAFMSGYITDIDKLKAGFAADTVSTLKGGYGGCREVIHVIMRMESSYMPWC